MDLNTKYAKEKTSNSNLSYFGYYDKDTKSNLIARITTWNERHAKWSPAQNARHGPQIIDKHK